MNIIHPNNSFDFTKLTLAQPSGIQGGAYFTKINYNQSPLYIQTPKSLTKQTIITSGKKLYCDLMFENHLIMLIEWFEKLESTCQQLIFEKSAEWFQEPLQLNDIENVFNSILKIYKSGKYYLVRVNVNKTINIYDETRNILSIEDIKTDTPIISILEIQGIKFTSRTFQIEIELKQAMIIDNSPVFDNCLISHFLQHTSERKDIDISPSTFMDSSILNSEPASGSSASALEPASGSSASALEPASGSSASALEPASEPALDTTLIDDTDDKSDKVSISDDDDGDNNDDVNVSTLEFEDLNDNDKKEELIEITEINTIPTQIISEPFILKKPNDVYYKIYREARTKAKEAKKQAILALLEAKNIKKTYMLDKIDGSDEEIDDEIDNISESELFI
jgi:hypothetical protein